MITKTVRNYKDVITTLTQLSQCLIPVSFRLLPGGLEPSRHGWRGAPVPERKSSLTRQWPVRNKPAYIFWMRGAAEGLFGGVFGLHRLPFVHEIPNLPHQVLVLAHDEIGGIALVVEARRHHLFLEGFDLPFAIGDPRLQI